MARNLGFFGAIFDDIRERIAHRRGGPVMQNRRFEKVVSHSAGSIPSRMQNRPLELTLVNGVKGSVFRANSADWPSCKRLGTSEPPGRKSKKADHRPQHHRGK